MPLTISYVIVGLIAVTANAHYVWKDDHDSTNHHSMFPRMNFPTFPGIPQFNFPSLPAFPMMPSMEFPQPHKGFNGVSVSASSFQGVDKDGKHYRKGGTSILTSEDGVEKEITLENGTPNVVVSSQPIVPPKIPIWQPSFDVSFMTNGPHTKSSKKPGKNQFRASSSVSSFSSSSNKDGVPHYEGVANVLQNVDGKVDQQTILISDN